jgi:hypothetical protein
VHRGSCLRLSPKADLVLSAGWKSCSSLRTPACLRLLFQRDPRTESRLATIYSLVEHGTFAIDFAPYETVDKVYVDGRYYFHQPPLQALAGALVYCPLRWLGMRLGPDERATYTVVTFAVNGLSALACLMFFYRSLRWTSLRRELRLPLTASLGYGTLLLPFSITLKNYPLKAGRIGCD